MKLISFGVERRGTCRAKTKTQQKTMKMNSFESDRGIKNVKKKCHTCFAVLEVYGTPKGGILFEEPAGLSSRTLDTKEQRHRVGNVGRILISLGVFFFVFFFYRRRSGCYKALSWAQFVPYVAWCVGMGEQLDPGAQWCGGNSCSRAMLTTVVQIEVF